MLLEGSNVNIFDKATSLLEKKQEKEQAIL